MTFNQGDVKRRMDASVEALQKEFSGLRTGRASTSLLDPITVEVYGSRMPITQVATVSAPEPRMLTVQVWDQTAVKSVEKAIRDAGLGLNPQPDGSLVRIPIPSLNEERRKELQKIAGKYAETAKVAVRNVRRDAMDALKKSEKEKTISQDEHKRLSDEVQKMTDGAVSKIDSMLADKEKDIMTV